MDHQLAIEHYNMGLEYSQQGDWDMAIESLKLAIEENPGYIKAYNVLGKVYIHKGDISTARKCWRESLKLDPVNPTAKECLKAANGILEYINIKWLLPSLLVIILVGITIINIISLHRFSQIQDKLEKTGINPIAKLPNTNGKTLDIASVPGIKEPVKDILPVSPKVYKTLETEAQLVELYNQALKDCLSGNYSPAIEAFNHILKYPKNHSLKDNAQYWLAECYYAQKDYERALYEFENVKKNFPKSNKLFDADIKIAYTYFKLGRIDAAEKKISQIRKDWPNQRHQSRISAFSEEIGIRSLPR